MSQARRCVRAMEIYAERRRHDDDYPMEIAVLTRSKCDFVKPYICQKDGSKTLLPEGYDALRLAKIYNDQGLCKPTLVCTDSLQGNLAARENQNSADRPLIDSIMRERIFVTDNVDAPVSYVYLRIILPEGYVYLDLAAKETSRGDKSFYNATISKDKTDRAIDHCWYCTRDDCNVPGDPDCLCNTCEIQRIEDIQAGLKHSSVFMTPKYRDADWVNPEVDLHRYPFNSKAPTIRFSSTRTLMKLHIRRIDGRKYLPPARRPHLDGVRFQGDDDDDLCEWCHDVPPALEYPEGPTQSITLNRKLHDIPNSIGEIPRFTTTLLNDVGEELIEAGYEDLIALIHPAILKALDGVKKRLDPEEFGSPKVDEYPFMEFAKSTLASAVLVAGALHEIKLVGKKSDYISSHLVFNKPRIEAMVNRRDQIVFVLGGLIEDHLLNLTAGSHLYYIIESHIEDSDCRMLPAYDTSILHEKALALYLSHKILSRKALGLPGLD